MYDFIYFTDVHFRLGSPVSRTDGEMLDVVSKKFEFLSQFTPKYAWLCGGDMGHSAIWNSRLIVRVSEILRILPRASETGELVVSTVGNHDVVANGMSSLPYTGLYVLQSLGCVRLLYSGEYIDFGDWRVFGYADNEKTTDDFIFEGVSPDTGGKRSIALVHASVGKEDSFGCVGVKNLNIGKVDIALFGDIHEGFEPTEVNGTLCANPGALYRSSFSERNRDIYVYGITSDGVIEKIPVPIEKEVFVESVSKQSERLGIDFVEDLEFLVRSGRIDVVECAERISKEKGYDHTVLQTFVEYYTGRTGI